MALDPPRARVRDIKRDNNGGLHFHVDTERRALPPPPADADDADANPIEALLSRLGGQGRIQVLRVQPNGRTSYSGQLHVTDDIVANFEAALATEFGGGEWEIVCLGRDPNVPRGEKNFGRARITIDERFYPPKKSEIEQRREGGVTAAPAPAAAAPTVTDPVAFAKTIEEMVEQRLQRVLAQLQANRPPADSQQVAILATMLDKQEKWIELLVNRQPPAAPAATAQADAATQMNTWATLFKTMGWAPAGAGGGGGAQSEDPVSDPKRHIAERVLFRVADKVAEKGGDAIGKLFEKEMGGGNQPASTPASTPAATAPAPKPQLPAGSIPILSREQLEKIRDQSRRGQAPAVPKKEG